MIDSPLADAEARELVLTYRAQMNQVRSLRLANGMGHESVRRQARLASMTAMELLTQFDLDADEMIEQLGAFDAAVAITTDSRAKDFAFALLSVVSVKIRRHDLGAVGSYFEQPEGTHDTVVIPEPRQSALVALENLGAIETDPTDVLRATRMTRYLGVRLTLLGEILHAQLND